MSMISGMAASLMIQADILVEQSILIFLEFSESLPS
jgi:hypothetical protein